MDSNSRNPLKVILKVDMKVIILVTVWIIARITIVVRSIIIIVGVIIVKVNIARIIMMEILTKHPI